jgi:hypothetical protein
MGGNGIQNLRAALARRERGRGKRYTSRLQRRIAEAATELRRHGHGWQAIGKFLGIPHETVRRFSGASTATTLVPVEIVDEANPRNGGLTLVSPEGYRIEGLGVGDAAEILRRLR